MSTFFWIIGSVILVSLISLIGILFINFKESTLQKVITLLVSFAAGALLGGAFLHLLPESLELENPFLYVIAGIVIFFIVERILKWRHCHKEHCEHHSFTYMSLIGDGIHNFIDGMVIAAAYLTNISLGISVTLAVIIHEIPQEIGDFAILLYGGFSKKKALLFNLISATTAILGAILIFIVPHSKDIFSFLLPFTAGGFIYIACVDLIPELHKNEEKGNIVIHIIALILGIVIMWGLKMLFE